MVDKDLNQTERHKSYDLTQRLAFFVIGIEVVFCAYLLLKAKDFSQYKSYLVALFLVSGISALLGIIWRFFFNARYYASTYKYDDSIDKPLPVTLQLLFVFASFVFFIFILVFGVKYINSL